MSNLIGLQIQPDFFLTNIIGSGSFATVYSAKKYNKQYAVKAFSKSNLTQKQLKTLQREATFMANLNNHKNIVQYHKSIQDGDYFFLIMELCEM
ncbi:hypothetical protein HDU92_000864, partial [Lobulomyces angularis]